MSNLFKKQAGVIVTNLNNAPEMEAAPCSVYHATFTETGLSLFIKSGDRKYRWDRNLSTDSGCEAAFSIVAAIAGKDLYDQIVEAETSEQGLAMLIGSEFFLTINGFGEARKFKISKTTTHTKIIPDLV